LFELEAFYDDDDDDVEQLLLFPMSDWFSVVWS